MRKWIKIALAILIGPGCLIFVGMSLYNLRRLPALPQPTGVVEREESEAWGRIPVSGTGCFVQSNVWNARSTKAFEQSVFSEKVQGKELVGWRWRWPWQLVPTVVAQPQIVCGDKPWDEPHHIDANFPFRAGSRKLSVDFDVRLQAIGTYNMAFSLWAVSSVPATRDLITHEIMIWNVRSGQGVAGKNIGSVDVNHTVYDIYLERDHVDASGSTKHAWMYIAFVARTQLLRGPLQLTAFTDWMLQQNLISRDHYLTSVELGNEVCSGTGIVELQKFQLHFE